MYIAYIRQLGECKVDVFVLLVGLCRVGRFVSGQWVCVWFVFCGCVCVWLVGLSCEWICRAGGFVSGGWGGVL